MNRHLRVLLALFAALLPGCGSQSQPPPADPAAKQAAVNAQIQQVQNDRSIPQADKAKIIAGIQAKGGQ